MMAARLNTIAGHVNPGLREAPNVGLKQRLEMTLNSNSIYVAYDNTKTLSNYVSRTGRGSRQAGPRRTTRTRNLF